MLSSSTAILFCLVVLAVALAVVVGLRRAGAGVRPLLAILFAYIAIPGHLARTGALRGWDASPPSASRASTRALVSCQNPSSSSRTRRSTD